jgi:hypothetical protein
LHPIRAKSGRRKHSSLNELPSVRVGHI